MVCIFLGPYRNLTTLWASVLSLHPNVQVCNHIGTHIKRTNCDFINGYSRRRVKNFTDYALNASKITEWSSKSGSITIDHAYKQNPEFNRLYTNRYGDKLVKDDIECLVWKESGRVTHDLTDKILQKMLENDDIKFFRPVRNPLDCAQSGIDKGYNFLVKDTSREGRLRGLLEDLKWFLNWEAKYPDKFLHLYEWENDFEKLAQFLDIKPDKQWLKESQEVYSINQIYTHSDEFVNTYKRLVEEIFENKTKLLEFVCGK